MKFLTSIASVTCILAFTPVLAAPQNQMAQADQVGKSDLAQAGNQVDQGSELAAKGSENPVVSNKLPNYGMYKPIYGGQRPPYGGCYKPKPDVSSFVGKYYAGTNQQSDPNKSVFDSQLPKPFRVIKPGQAVTMDFVQNRLNLDVDENNMILKVHYG